MAKTPSKIAKRYARALFESFEPTKLEGALAALQSLSRAWESNDGLRAALVNPAIKESERLAVMVDLAKRASDGDEFVSNFSQLILENGRVSLLPEITVAFSTLLDLLKKRLALEVVSAFDIDSTEREQVLEQVRRDFGGLATIQWSVDPEIIGGLRIQAGDMLLDGSIAGALADLRSNLTQ